MNIKNLILICIALALIGCTNEGNFDMDRNMVHDVYVESDKVFANPERGFYTGQDFKSADANPIKPVVLVPNRYAGRTLIYTGYYLTDYMESDISSDFLELIRTNMKALREGGMKCILRFAYKTDMYETGHPWDASPQWVARHIEQLKPILQEYGDVIFCLQAGFIGVWGEWCFTDHFVLNPVSVKDHELRKKVMVDLLDAMPKDRQIALRTPMFKRKMFLESYADSITLATAFDGSDLSRICGHNDCFGADATDMGTFSGKDPREFWKKETRYVIMGGETCQVSEFSKCTRSLKDLEDYHWTYLNFSYNTGVHVGWKQQGCYDEIERRLGYRLSLTDVFHTKYPKADSDFRIVLKIQNTGFAAPMNPRSVEFVLKDGNGTRTTYAMTDIDPRYWFAGETIIIDKTIKLPEEAQGVCNLYLNLPDPKEALHDNPLFSIRLANDGIWDKEAGYNKVADFKL